MAKEKTLKDLLNGLAKVFKKDLYIVYGSFCIGGDEPNESLPGDYLIKINPDFVKKVTEHFGKFNVIYITDVKKLKDSLGTIDEYPYVRTNINSKAADRVAEKVSKLENTINSIDSWDVFNFTDEQVLALLNSEMVTLFTDNVEIPNLVISKTVFPAITKGNIRNIYYNVNKGKIVKGSYDLFTSVDLELYQLYSSMHFIEIKNNDTKD